MRMAREASRPSRSSMSDSMSRSCGRLRSPGEGPRKARPAWGAAVRVDRRPGGHVRDALGRGVIDEAARELDEGALRALVPRVLAGLVRRGEDFDAAEDALQEALLEALRVWPEHPPRDPRAWLTTVATPRLVGPRPSEAAPDRPQEAGLL